MAKGKRFLPFFGAQKPKPDPVNQMTPVAAYPTTVAREVSSLVVGRPSPGARGWLCRCGQVVILATATGPDNCNHCGRARFNKRDD